MQFIANYIQHSHMKISSGSFFSSILREDEAVVAGVEDIGEIRKAFIEAQHRIVWTRQHVWKYNALLGVFLAVIWLVRRFNASRRAGKQGRGVQDPGYHEDAGSDSSSTLTGTATPPDVKRIHDVEDEQSPLLPQRSSKRHRSILSRGASRLQAFLMYQPPPLPLVHKTLPDNGTSLLVLAFVILNLVLCVVAIPFKRHIFIMVAGDRTANLFSANLPLLYFLAAKNQPLKHITGFSYEALNIFHRRLGELLCFFALIHMGTQFNVFYTLYQPLIHIELGHFLTEPLILMGVLAFICYESLYFTSLGSFRQRWYEVFLASHIVLQACGLGFLWFHFHCSQLYVLSAVLIFLIDRMAFRLMLNSTTKKGSLEVLEDGETVMLSADWAITGERPFYFGRKSIIHGWDPCAHVFVTIDVLSRSAVLQAHPFTIASAAPDLTVAKPYAWLNLLIRAHDGFSRDLLRYAQTHSKVDVRFDGPYGSLEPLHMLEDSDHAVLVAGGSGIAVVFPLIWALLHDTAPSEIVGGDHENNDILKPKQRRRRVTLIWVIHSASHASWMPKERLDELVQLGLDLRISPPTATHGRPDVRAMVQEIVYTDENSDSGRKSVGVVVSGPDALNRDVRNTCAQLVGEGQDVKITVEKFGW